MKYLVALAALALVVFVGANSQPVQRYFDDRAALERMQAEQQLLERQRTQPLDDAFAFAWRVLALALACGAAYVALDFYRQRRKPLVATDALALPRAALGELDTHTVLALMREYMQSDAFVRALAAQHQPGQTPASLSYNPHYSSRNEASAQIAAPLALESVLQLPDAAPLSSVLAEVAPGKIAYGLLADGAPLVLGFGQAYHALAAGDTRSGKSNYLDSIITQLHHQSHHYDLRLLIGDFKREMASTWERSPLVEAVETDPAIIADMLIELARGDDGILQRYEAFKAEGEARGRVIRNLGDWVRVTGERPRLTFCVIDELNALIEAADRKDDVSSALKVVLQTGAGAGVYVLSGAQYLTAKTFGRDGSKQFTTRAMFGAYDQTAYGMLFGAGKLAPEVRIVLTGAAGRGLIRTAGQPTPTPFQALRCDEADILEAISLVGVEAISTATEVHGKAVEVGGRSFHEAPERSDDQTMAETISGISQAENSIAGFPAERYFGVKYLRMKGETKSAIIKQLWNTTSGRSYQTASAEYEAIVKTLEAESRN